MNKRGVSIIEMVVSALILGILLTMVAQVNSILINSSSMVQDLRDGSSVYDYATHYFLREIKSSHGTYNIQEDNMKIYQADGTYKEASIRLKSLYLGGEKIAALNRGSFRDCGEYIEINLSFKDYATLNLKVYKPKILYETNDLYP